MHVMFIHQNFPAQFGHIAAWLIRQKGWTATFVTNATPKGLPQGMRLIHYQPVGGATPANSFLTRTFENAVAHSQGVYQALRDQKPPRPDLIVAHSGFGSSLFLRDLYQAPIINFFEYFYRPSDSDLDFRPDTPVSEQVRLRSRTRNAMILLDLANCDLGYTPTQFQHSLFPKDLQKKIRIIFDGMDTDIFKKVDNPPRRFAGKTISPDTRVVTYCSRGFEKMRGFDYFMQAAKRIYQQHPNVVFIIVGSDRVCYGNGELERGEHGSFREAVLAQGDFDESKFIFTGQVPASRLVEVLSLGDAHIYLTAPFVLSWSMMNALSCGALVIGSDTAPVREMITHEHNGLLADFFSPQAIAEQTLRVLRDPAAFKPIRENAAAMIREKYSMEVVLPKMLEMYEDVGGS